MNESAEAREPQKYINMLRVEYVDQQSKIILAWVLQKTSDNPRDSRESEKGVAQNPQSKGMRRFCG